MIGTTAGTFNGNIIFSSTGAANVTKAVTGTVIPGVWATFPQTESFDTTPFPPSGWVSVNTVPDTGGGAGTWTRETVGVYPDCSPHSGAGMIQYDCFTYEAGTQGTLATPSMTLPGDDYQVAFWLYRDDGYPDNADRVNVYFNTAQNLTGTPILLGTVNLSTILEPVVASVGWYKYTFNFPAASSGTGKYVIIEGVSEYGDNIHVDDFIVQQQPPTPGAAIITYPLAGDPVVGPNPAFTWTAGLGNPPTGYKFYLGTDSPPTNLVNGTDLGNVLTYTYGSALTAGTAYNWKVVPYNAGGDCVEPVILSFTTASPMGAAIATTPSPANGATLVNPMGTLSWAAVANASSYDVYFGTTLPGTPNATVTSPTWTHPTCSYSTLYSWKVVARNGFGVSTGTPTVWTFTAGPDPLITAFPYAESFDGTTFEPYAWTNVSSTGDTYKWTGVTAGVYPTCAPHSGAGMAEYNSFNSAADNTAILATPPLVIPADDYRASFWMYGDPGYPTLPGDRIEVSLNTTPTAGGTVLATISRYNATAGWNQYVYPLGAGSTGTKYLVFNAISAYGNNMFIDDVAVQQISARPLPAIVVSPANNATSIDLAATLNWTSDLSGSAPTGYRLSMGTDNPPTNLVSNVDLGLVTTYTPSPALSLNGHYYWQIVPYNADGDAVGSVVWDFRTVGVPGVVTTFTPANGAVDIARNAPFTWGAVTTATSYDVYFGTTLPATPNANVTVLTWTPPLMDVTTTYVWKVVPKNAYGDATGCPVWTFTTGTLYMYAESYATSTVDDDIGQFSMADVTNPAIAPSPLENNPASANTYTDFTALTVNVLQDHVYPISILQINSEVMYDCQVGIYIDYNQNGTFDLPAEEAYIGATSTDPLLNPVLGNVSIPAAAPIGNTRLRVVLREGTTPTSPTGTYSWGETEDYTIHIAEWLAETPPSPAIVVSPANAAVGIPPAVSLNWSSGGGGPTGYRLYLGTDGGGATTPTNLVNNQDMLTATTYTPVPALSFNTTYYWQVIAYNTHGDASGSSIWSFTTGGPVVNMANGSLTVPAGISYNFYDSGGPAADYQNDEYYTFTFYPQPGQHIVANFTEFATEATYDYLEIYDGADATAPALHTGLGFDGTTNPGTVTATGALTFVFSSDVSGMDTGWAATIASVMAPVGPPDAVTLTLPIDGAADVSPLGLNLTWSNALTGGTATYYSILVGANPIDPANDYYGEYLYETPAPTNSFNLSTAADITLSYGSQWYWAVQANNADGFSPLSSCFGFRIMPDPTIVSFPYTQDFNVWPPANWTLSGTFDWQQYGLEWAVANFYTTDVPNNCVMTTPPISSPSSLTLGFTWSHLYDDLYPLDQLDVEYSTNGSTWTNLWTKAGTMLNSTDGASNTAPGTGVVETISLPAALQGVSFWIRFNGITDYGPDLFVDNVTLTVSTGTLTAPVVTIINDAGSPSLSWAAISGATAYTVYSDTNPNGTFATVEINTDLLTWTDTAASAGKFYKVTANNNPYPAGEAIRNGSSILKPRQAISNGVHNPKAKSRKK